MTTIVLLLAGATAAGAEPAATEQTVRTLMELTQSRKMVDSALAQVDGAMQAGMNQALAGKQLNAKQQAIFDRFRKDVAAMMAEGLKWETLEPIMIRIYTETFTEKELNDMIGFYRSPSGQALIAKQPQVLQKSMELMQARMITLSPRIQAMEKDVLAQLQAAVKDEAAPAPAPKPAP
jgi:hypothetical protein